MSQIYKICAMDRQITREGERFVTFWALMMETNTSVKSISLDEDGNRAANLRPKLTGHDASLCTVHVIRLMIDGTAREFLEERSSIIRGSPFAQLVEKMLLPTVIWRHSHARENTGSYKAVLNCSLTLLSLFDWYFENVYRNYSTEYYR